MMSVPTDDGPWLVVGLGNPGPSYAGNRHNAGFMVIDLLAGRSQSRLKSHRSRSDVAEVRLAGARAVLARPHSFMNLSGGPVAAVRNFYKADVARIIVIHDELDIPFGAVRLKRGGGDNGHNGLRSITSALGTRDYLRVRVGIGRPPGRTDPADFVLRDFTPTERRELPLLLEHAADSVEMLVTDGLEPAQNRYHALL